MSLLRALGPSALLAALLAAEAPGNPATGPDAFVTFSLNVQDFSYPERSADLLGRVVALHERLEVPVDVYLTTTMVDLYEQKAPDLLEKLRSSPWVAVSYHVRPPLPYYKDYDWLGLGRMPVEMQAAIVLDYETHGLDLASGRPTAAPGGFDRLSRLLGHVPWVASTMAGPGLQGTVDGVFRELGARFTLVHGRIANLGESRDGLFLRPEHLDLKLFEHRGEEAPAVVEAAVASARAAAGAKAPYFVGVKMHDNDFFASRSAWLTVYGGRDRTPPWDVSLQAPLLSGSMQQETWSLYESTVGYVSAARERLAPVNARGIAAMLGQQAPPDPVRPGTVLVVSGTMHIETNRVSWPRPDALVAFLERATAAGTRWSIGADVGWLVGEPRAADVIRATEALGVEWDVHAHHLADRARCADLISRMGGHPTGVASGVVVAEIDEMRAPLVSVGTRWQATALWGLVLNPDHRDGSDDESYGLWRPASGARWTEHDPSGTLVAVGGGARTLAGAEQAAAMVAAAAAAAPTAASSLPPVLSASVMVSPASLEVIGEGAGIDEILAWAARMGALEHVRWGTIAESAAAWVAAGGVASRTDPLAPGP